MLLKNKIVIVSGIGPGLGVKLAIEAAREGAAGVVCAARSAEKLDDAERRILEVTDRCGVLKCVTDITDRAACERLVAQTIERFGRIDALINSAFVHGEMDYASTANLDDWHGPLNTNLLGTLKLTQSVLPQMKAQKSGAIVMVNTMAVRQVPPLGEAGYAASKAALAVSTKYLAKELGPHRIRVNTVHMGWMWGCPGAGLCRLAGQPARHPGSRTEGTDRDRHSARRHSDRRRVRARRAVHGVGLRQCGDGRCAGRQRRRLDAVIQPRCHRYRL
jgi:NAD(P)-dependent dehydrogenase (short-subunit alcohol dehydrogenase family)